jgi:tRNA threonylcarbamoyladenosine biosynthesis protein TsaB
MASAKGLCTALNIPLLTINTLELMAKDAILHYRGDETALFCSMIDARRMEIYTAIYDQSLKEILKPCAMILDSNSYKEFQGNYTLINFGSGSDKWKNVVKLRNSKFIQNVNLPVAMAILTHDLFTLKRFTDLVYSEPLYLKEFYKGA